MKALGGQVHADHLGRLESNQTGERKHPDLGISGQDAGRNREPIGAAIGPGGAEATPRRSDGRLRRSRFIQPDIRQTQRIWGRWGGSGLRAGRAEGEPLRTRATPQPDCHQHEAKQGQSNRTHVRPPPSRETEFDPNPELSYRGSNGSIRLCSRSRSMPAIRFSPVSCPKVNGLWSNFELLAPMRTRAGSSTSSARRARWLSQVL